MAAARRLPPAAIGLRAHSGWAALVAVAVPHESIDGSPVVISRKQIVIADSRFPGSNMPYHFVELMSQSEASAIIARCWKSSVELAFGALESEKQSLKGKGFEVSSCAVLEGRMTETPPLDKVLKSHPMLHTADGIHFRETLKIAAEGCAMRVVRLYEHGLMGYVAKKLAVPTVDLTSRIASMGRQVGSPWTEDQKYAAAAAWFALAQP